MFYISFVRWFARYLYVGFRSTQIKTYSWDNAQVVLVGNKCDLDDERVVSTDRGKQLAMQMGWFMLIQDDILS